MTRPVLTQSGLGFADPGGNRCFKTKFTCFYKLFILAALLNYFLCPGTTFIHRLTVDLCSSIFSLSIYYLFWIVNDCILCPLLELCVRHVHLF